jgi:SLT domain-containing protein
MLANVEAFKLRIDELAASADGLGIVFRDIFVGGFSNFLSDLMSGTKSLKDAFLDFARSVEQAITRIVAQNLAQSLFGTTGPLAGVSGFFARLFGSPVAGARADGGPVAANQSYLVGERGPEIFKPSIPGTIIPNERLKLETQVQGPKLLGAPAPRLAQALAATVVGMALPAFPAAAAPSSALANTPRVTLPSGPPEVQAIAARLQTPLPAAATAALPPYMAAPLPPTLAAGLARRLAAVVEPAEMAVKTEERESELMNASRLPLGESLAVRISGSLQGGGPVYRNQAYLVGEAGPEVFIPGINGTVLPNKPAADNKPAGPNIVINNTFAAGTDLRTIDQAATQIGLRVQRALRRN